MSPVLKSLEEKVNFCVNELSGICDAVVVIATITNADGENDYMFCRGSGSQYTRYAMCEEQVLKWRQYIKTHAEHLQNKEYEDGDAE